MKILHLLQSDRFSGAENVVCQIFGMLRDAPDIEMVYCSSDGQIREALAERGMRFIPLPTFRVGEIRKVLRAARHAREFLCGARLRQNSADLAHSQQQFRCARHLAEVCRLSACRMEGKTHFLGVAELV